MPYDDRRITLYPHAHEYVTTISCLFIHLLLLLQRELNHPALASAQALQDEQDSRTGTIHDRFKGELMALQLRNVLPPQTLVVMNPLSVRQEHTISHPDYG